VEIQGRENGRLCQEILDCQQQLTQFRTRLHRLKAEHKKRVQLQAVRVQASKAWPALSRKDKWKKCYLLAAIKDSPCLPKPLREDMWESRVPLSVRHDPELFMARLQRPEFTHYYRCGGHVWTLPLSLRHNKQVVLHTVQYYPEILLQCENHGNNGTGSEESGSDSATRIPILAPQFLDDVDVVRALLKSTVHIANPGANHLLAVFSERVRSDCDVMLQVLQRHPYCLTAIGPALRNNTAFALAFANNNNQKSENDMDHESASSASEINDGLEEQQCHHVPVPDDIGSSSSSSNSSSFPSDALKSFSSRLRADKEVATAFCRRAGGNLAYCSYPLRRDLQLVLAAVDNDPTAIVYCIKSRTKRTLSSDHDYMRGILKLVVVQQQQQLDERQHESSSNIVSIIYRRHGGGTAWKRSAEYTLRQRLWRFCAPAIKQQRDIVVAALAANCATMQDVPEHFKNDRSFWVDCLILDPFRWLTLPEHFKNDRELASLAVQHIRCHDGAAIIDVITEQFRGEPRYDRNALMTMARQFPFQHAAAVWPWAHQMWDDKEILLQACRSDGDVLELVQMSLISDRDVIATALHTTPDALCFVPSFVQHMYPDLVAGAIRDTPQDELWDLYEMVDEDLWENREIALAWVGQGGDYLHDDFPTELESDRELFLLVAAHNPEDFWCASDDLLGEKEFMLQVVEKDGNLLRDASEDLVQDYDLALVAFAGTSNLVGKYLTGRVRDFQFLVEFAKKVRARLLVHEGFVKGVLCGTTQGTLPMSILNQGRETTFAYTKLIADFLGIPRDTELRCLRQASSNLATWGF
jgi:hypothetical protein